jgi:hypothetical protein
MNINYHLSPYPALLENMFAKVYEASSPDAEVASIEIFEKDAFGVPTVGAGHQVPNSISFNGLDKVTHIVRLFTASATKLHEYDVQPTADNVTLFDPIFFVVGDGGTYTPITDSSTLSNPAFDGLEAKDITIFQRGNGPLVPLVEYTISGSAVTLINGDVFSINTPWYVLKKPAIVTNPVNDSVVGKGFGGFVNIAVDTDYSASHLRKLIRFTGTGNYTFPVGANIPIGYNHSFNNFGVNPSTPRVNFSNGTLLYGGSPKSFIEVPFGSTVTFTWDGVNWNMTENGISDTEVTSPVSGDIVGQGNYNIGDLPSGDPTYTITHGLSLGYSYRVLGSIRSLNPVHARDNTITWAWYEPLPNSFKITLQEIYGEAQNISFDWILVKN